MTSLSVQDRPDTAPAWYSRGRNVLRREAGDLRLLEFLLFFLMCLPFTVPGTGLDAHQFMPIVAVACAVCLRPALGLGSLRWVVVLNVVMLVYIGLVSALAEHGEDAEDWRRRLFRLVVTTALLWFLGTGRLHLRSALIGYTTGLIINVPTFYLGFGSHEYGRYLAGFIGDKNQAGLAYTIFGILALSLVRGRNARILVAVLAGGALWLTGSRTSLAAFAAAILWILVAHRLSGAGRLVLGGIVYWLVSLLSEGYSQLGVFSDRVGSDLLRERIDDASWQKVQETGFLGQGLGEAVVRLGTTTEAASHRWFFHNSYWSAFVEGGWPWLVFVVGLTVFLGLRPLARRRSARGLDRRIGEGAALALLVCAWRLGEVFYTTAWAVVLGYCVHVMLTHRARRREVERGSRAA